MKQRQFDIRKNFKEQVIAYVRIFKPDYVVIGTQDKNEITRSGAISLPNIGVPLLAAKRGVDKGHFILFRRSPQTWYCRDIAKKGRPERVLNIEKEELGRKPDAMMGESQTMRELHNAYIGKIPLFHSSKLKAGEVFFCESI